MAEEGKMAYVIPAKRKGAEIEQAGREHCDKKHIAARDAYAHRPEVHNAVSASLEGVAEKNARRAAVFPGIACQATDSDEIDQIKPTGSIDQDDTESIASLSVSPPFALDLEHISTLSWHQVGLAAEEEKTSLFGRFKQLTERGLVHASEVEKMSAIGNLFAATWMAVRQDGTVPRSQFPSGKADDEEWRWAEMDFEAEDRGDSIAGATRVLVGLGVLGEDFEVELRGLGMVFARTWLFASSTADTAGRVDLGRRAVRSLIGNWTMW